MQNAKLLARVAETAGIRASLLESALAKCPPVWTILGPPAAGKGTYSQLLARWTGLPVIAVGKLLRSRLGTHQQEASMVTRGELLPDDYITQLVARELQHHGQSGAILDGFPRTLAQAHALSRIADVQQAINLRLPDEALVQKSLARRSCGCCGRVFSMRSVSLSATPERPGLHLPAILPGPSCKPHLTTRFDDTPAAVLRRLQVHKEQAAPIEAFFRRAGLLQDVHVSGSVEHMRPILLSLMRMGGMAPAQQERQELAYA